ncbi:DUF554 domain-containing protein [Curtanaerobium respiraculi]|uniref:DUF554 domain-containing protein n=1 Tax=Curtanaerobium respiraculi TaxID=2949669 RepID=UPI0024B3A917|nr:DUF554 domain-containing protein [Curtanaerobium respiraculi]
MIGTFVNAGAIMVGSFIGGTARRAMSERLSEALMVAMGCSAVVIGLNSAVQNMPNSAYPVLFIVSLALGVLAGTLLDIDGRVNRRVSKGAGGGLGEGIITASLIFCVGALSILGPVQSALYGDNTFLFTNAMLDFVTSMVFASTYGLGICLAAGILLCWQGGIFGITLLLGDFISGSMMTELSVVGGVLIAMSGLGILRIKDCKTLNFLPALLVPVIWCMVAPLL